MVSFGGMTKDCKKDATSCWTLFKTYLMEDAVANKEFLNMCRWDIIIIIIILVVLSFRLVKRVSLID